MNLPNIFCLYITIKKKRKFKNVTLKIEYTDHKWQIKGNIKYYACVF